MKVKELIEKLEQLPKDATIGSFDAEDNTISELVAIYGKQDDVYTSQGATTIREIEDSRYSNKSKLCDYYIGF